MRRHPRRTITACIALTALLTLSCAQIQEQLANLPRLTDEDLRNKLAQSSVIFAGDGSVLTTLHGEENRTIIESLKRIPKQLQHAVVGIEDERFYEHEGVDWKAIVRAAVTNAAAGEIKEGGSTITQQYVKNVIIAPGETAEKTLERKLNEAALARQLEQRLSKDEILLKYLNTVYFGQGAYGVQAAAKTYFGKPVWRLTLHECAMLAGLIRAPTDYDPYVDKAAAKARRDLVLAKMAELGYASAEGAARAQSKNLQIQRETDETRYPAPYFVDYVQRLLTYDERFEKIGKTVAQRTNALFQGGLRIYTTIDLETQAAAEEAVANVLTFDSDPHGSLVALEPETGYVKAMVGGRDWFAPRKQDPYAKLNLAILAEPGLGSERDDGKAAGTGRQAGSSFKPFALAAAIENGVPLAKTYKAQSCMDFPGEDAGGTWHVCNYDSSSFGSNLTLLEATVRSVNVVYAQVILEIGPEAVVEIAEAMGINTELLAVPSAVLGSSPVNPLGMASGFGTFATGGTRHPPVAITRIEDATGKVLYRDPEESEEVIKPAVAYLTTAALEQVIQRGTGTGAAIGRPAAGKTGTAQEYRDAWFVGYTPDLVAAVWVGYPGGEIEMKPSCTGSLNPCLPTRIQVTGGSWPAQIWQIFMLRALSGVTATSFPIPSIGIVTITIDSRNGCLAGRFTPEEFQEDAIYPKGSEPEETCREPGDATKVPNVFGFPVKDAVRILEGAGFEVEQVDKESSTYPPGRVIGQSPEGDRRAPKGSTVVIEVSVPEGTIDDGDDENGNNDNGDEESATVPDVLGYSRSAAEDALRDAGFNVQVVVQSESDHKQAKKRKGRVWKQSPGGGASADRGSTVTIWVNP